jgi:UDP-glucose 4-epimerase
VKVLVTGGAGYVGSVIAARLAAAGHDVTIYDDLSRGHRAAVPPDAVFAEGDVRDGERLRDVLAAGGCRAVVHMAALAEVAESIAEPERYRDVNLGGTQALVRAALATGVERIVFSSTAAVYGAPRRVPIDEDDPTEPTNPYGETKLAAEATLREAAAAGDGRLSYIALRYFNACGADRGYGEDHDPETHLISVALRAARDGTPLKVFGDDYPTPDGTCVRDYVHVVDLADAHIAALHAPPLNVAINLGTGAGDSVLAVLRAIERVTGRPARYELAGRRTGDPPVLVASNARAADLLGWRPRLGLAQAVADAWAWLETHPFGYGHAPVQGVPGGSGD